MKKFFHLIFFLVLCLWFFNACKKADTPNKQAASSGANSSLSITSVPLETALQAIWEYGELWRTTRDSLNLPDDLKTTQAFLIKKEDLLGALGIEKNSNGIETPYQQGRAYIGMVNDTAHLYFVPVDNKGNDIIPGEPGERYVYDLITPCPNTCSPSSLLYQAFHEKLGGKRD